MTEPFWILLVAILGLDRIVNGVFASWLAQLEGRSRANWFILGVLLGPFAILAVGFSNVVGVPRHGSGAPTLVFSCSECGRQLSVSAKYAGQPGKCNHCGTKMVVPQTRHSRRILIVGMSVHLSLCVSAIFYDLNIPMRSNSRSVNPLESLATPEQPSSKYLLTNTEQYTIESLVSSSEDTPSQALAEMVSEKRIINVKEHVQGTEITEKLLTMMDSSGIGKTILMGSPRFVITLRERDGFTGYDENNLAIMEMVKRYPERFEAWPTIDPADPLKLEKLKLLVARGATGVKIYLGNGYISREGRYVFHSIAMDDPEMLVIYKYLSTNHLPVCYQVNPSRPGFMDEFVQVLLQHPDLKVITPQYMLSSMVHSRIHAVLKTFPNLYMSIDFGHDDYLKKGLKLISSNKLEFRQLFEEFPDRFMFGSNFVLTDLRPESPNWYELRIQAYLDMLTKPEYTTELLPGVPLNGLELSPAILEQILYVNYNRFQISKPRGTQIIHDLDWKVLRTLKTDRPKGIALPAPFKPSSRGPGFR